MSGRALVTGGGGFIGGHLVRHLLSAGYRVTAADIKPVGQWSQSHEAATNVQVDLKRRPACGDLVHDADVIYHLAADVGGIGYITGHDWNCASSVRITQNLLELAIETRPVPQFFFASSACVYPTHLQSAVTSVPLREDMAFPANPEQGYGWAKLYSELLCSYAQGSGLPIRIARLFNVYGPNCDFLPPRAKAPGALCYKFLQARRNGGAPVQIWGDGNQVRSFLYIDDCLDAIEAMMQSDHQAPLNLASDETVSISDMADMLANLSGVPRSYEFMPGMPTGVSSRIPCIDLAREELGWAPKMSLSDGLTNTYEWMVQHAA